MSVSEAMTRHHDKHNRHPKGTPTGGQFAAGSKPKPNYELEAETIDTPGDETASPSHEITEEQVSSWIDNPDPAVQAQALAYENLSDEQLLLLSDPTRDLSVRWMVATDPRALAGLLAADDPDPRVRALVASRPDTPETLRSELLADPEVSKIASKVPSDPLAEGVLGFRRMVQGEQHSPPEHPVPPGREQNDKFPWLPGRGPR